MAGAGYGASSESAYDSGRLVCVGFIPGSPEEIDELSIFSMRWCCWNSGYDVTRAKLRCRSSDG